MQKPAPIDDDATTGGQPGGLLVRLTVGILIAIPAMAMAYLVLAFLVGGLIDAPLRGKPVDPATLPGELASILLRWGVFGPIQPNDRGYFDRFQSIEKRMRGIHGSSESGGWNGDGTDWYEVELAPDLMAELRASVVRFSIPELTSTLPQGTPSPPRTPTTPAWWPMQWPTGTRWYRGVGDLSSLAVPPTGNRIWFYHFRW